MIDDMDTSSFFTKPICVETSAQWTDIKLISVSGHNVLYQATKHGNRFMLKILGPEYASMSAYEALHKKEFDLGVQLDHPNVVRTIDMVSFDQIGQAIVLEYVDGMTLGEFLEEQPSRLERKRVLLQIINAVAYLHGRQIMHRDLKPSNILITRNGHNVKLIDFGISDADSYVALKQPAGSPYFMAPEQQEGRSVDCRADLYAIGKLMRLLIPARYKYIVRKCTRTNPAKRYSSCAALLKAIRREDAMWRILAIMPIVILSLVLGGYLSQRQARINEQQQARIFEQQQTLDEYDAVIIGQQSALAAQDSLLANQQYSLAAQQNSLMRQDSIIRNLREVEAAHHKVVDKANKLIEDYAEKHLIGPVRRGDYAYYEDAYKERMMPFYTQVGIVRDSVATTIDDPVLRAEFLNAAVVRTGQLATYFLDNVISKLPRKN